jgi:hypothetical protein
MTNRSGNGPNLMYKCHKIIVDEVGMLNGYLISRVDFFNTFVPIVDDLFHYYRSKDRLSQMNQRFVNRYPMFMYFETLSRNSRFRGSGMIIYELWYEEFDDV